MFFKSNLTLKFQDEEENESYVKAYNEYHLQCICWVFGIQIVQFGWQIIFFIAYLKVQFSLIMWFLSILGPVLEILAFFLIIRSRNKLYGIFICLELTWNLIYLSESVVYQVTLGNSWATNSMTFIQIGICFGIWFGFIGFAKIHFHIHIFFGIFAFGQNLIRILLVIEEARFLAGLIIFFGACIWDYFHHRQEKADFHKKYLHEKTLEQFKWILYEKFPNPIIIQRKFEETKENRNQFELCFKNAAFIQVCELYWEAIENNQISIREEAFTSQNIKKAINLKEQNKEEKLIEMLSNTLNFFNLTSKEKCTIQQYKANEIKNIHQKVIHAPILWQDREAILILFEDISSFIELDDFKDKLLATVSHDLRTPLQGCIGMIECSLECENFSKIKKLLKNCQKAAKGLQILVSDLLDQSQFINGKLSLHNEETNIISSIKEVNRIIKFQCKSKGIDFQFNQKIDKTTIIQSDGNRIKQILYNLLGNAIKFTKPGGKIMVLSDQIIMNKQKQIYIEVADTGIGIHKENIPILFTMFGKLTQPDNQTNKHGVGLGLQISNVISKLLNPNFPNNGLRVFLTSQKIFQVESQLGIGSKFQFYLPFNLESIDSKEECTNLSFPPNLQQKTLRQIQLQCSIAKQSYANKRCLLVDDDFLSMMPLVHFLDSQNVKQIKAQNGEEALKIVTEEIKRGNSFDFILMDKEMPIMDGVEASSKMKQAFITFGIRPILIILLSGDLCTVDNEIGIVMCLQKPISKQEIEKIICHCS